MYYIDLLQFYYIYLTVNLEDCILALPGQHG